MANCDGMFLEIQSNAGRVSSAATSSGSSVDWDINGSGSDSGMGSSSAISTSLGGDMIPTTIWACRINGCTKQFAREADLKRHQRTTKTHSVPSFTCPQCDASFTRPDALRRHQKSRHQGVVIEQKEPPATKSIIDENMTSKYRLNMPTTTAKGKGKAQAQAPTQLPLRITAKRSSSLSCAQLQPTTTSPSRPSTYYRQHTMSISPHAPARSSQSGARGTYTSNPPGGHYQPSPHYRPHTLGGTPSSSAPSSKAATPTPTTNGSSGNVIARQPPQLSFPASRTTPLLSFPPSSPGSCSVSTSPIPVPVLFGDDSSSPSRSSEDTPSTDSNPDSDECQIDGHDESELTPWPEEVAAAVEAVLNMHSQRKHLSAGVSDMNASDDGMPFIIDPEQAKMDLDEDIRRFPPFTMDHILMGDVQTVLHPA